jgi:hypothetical protein
LVRLSGGLLQVNSSRPPIKTPDLKIGRFS